MPVPRPAPRPPRPPRPRPAVEDGSVGPGCGCTTDGGTGSAGPGACGWWDCWCGAGRGRSAGCIDGSPRSLMSVRTPAVWLGCCQPAGTGAFFFSVTRDPKATAGPPSTCPNHTSVAHTSRLELRAALWIQVPSFPCGSMQPPCGLCEEAQRRLFGIARGAVCKHMSNPSSMQLEVKISCFGPDAAILH